MKEKYIFVDVDGVMHNAFGESEIFEKECMENLKEIVTKTGAKLVLSSSWRGANSPTEMTVSRHLAKYGMTLVDRTPQGESRPLEIRTWLMEHNYPDYIVIDDWDMTEDFGRRMICTTLGPGESGLRKKHVELAIKALN